LSCYRDYLLSKYSKEKVDVWGDISLYTPNIDRLANEGALYTNFYTVAPLCTPSRASFVTGLYPQFTGDSKMNHGKMDLGLTTWAEILRADKGYHTGYMGKWHLDGPEKPLWGSNNRDFGFEDNKYRYNRGHWKYFSEINGDPMGYEMEGESLFPNAYKEHYATDFLMDRGIEFIESAVDNNDPFALVLSIPDPHGPNENRPYYRNMFNNIEFRIPETARKNWKFNPAPAGFNSYGEGEGPPVDDVDNWIDEYENGGFWQRHMQQYYGMVKCVDYNIGRLLQTLSDKGIDDNTIIVFTSDHGDQLMEHGKLNKGRPYETSAGIPFLVRYPGTVPAGKVIETAHSSIDFAPTILSLMGVDYSPDVGFQGVDGSEELTDSRAVSNNENQIVFSFDTGNKPTWAAAIKGGYKLIVQKNGIPWFYDLQLDPEEMTNYIDSSMHAGIVEELRLALVQAIKDYNAPLLEVTNTIYLAKPKCYDSKNVLPLNNGKNAFCRDLGNTLNISKCNNQHKIRTACPFKCGACECEDTPGLIFVDGSARSCDTLQNVCHEEKVRRFCPATCNTCTNS
jgi:arylsulfatase A-like enzyme